MNALRFSLVATFLIAFAGCGAPSTPSESSDAAKSARPTTPAGGPDYGDTIIEIIDAEPAHMNPILATSDGDSRYMGRYIFELLLELDLDTFEFKPMLAKSWEISDDHLTFTFHLDENAQFSDGHPVTTADVKYTFDMVMDPSNDTGPLRSYLLDIDEIKPIDEHTITFHAKKPYFGLFAQVSDVEIYPKHIYEGKNFNDHPLNRAPVGSGPYVFERWDTGQQIAMTRNEHYWGKKPAYIDKRVFRLITDDEAAFQVVERQEADLFQNMSPEKFTGRAARPQFEAKFQRLTPDSPVPGFLSRFNYIGWNMRKPQFADKRVRQALCMLFDRQSVIDTVWAGLGTIITGSEFHKLPEYNQNVKPLPFDPEAAKKLLDEAGWTDRDRDGVRENSDGVKLEFELGFASGVPEYVQLGAVYQEELTRAGIKCNLNPMEWATFQERVQKRTFDACMLAWLTTVVSDPYQLWHSSQTETGSNYPGISNAEADKLMEDARPEFDHEKRVVLYHRLHEILHDEQPYLFLYARPGLVAVDKRFEGVVLHKGGLDPREWWVPKAKQRYDS
ncbi:MAG: peptide-binding protein [Candidatus Hydrogenedentota bacterium]|mgnify:CR=1 FL=1